MQREKCFSQTGIFYFVLVFLAVDFIIVYSLLCFTTTNQKLEMMLLIIGATKKKTPDVIKEELLDSLIKTEDEDEHGR